MNDKDFKKDIQKKIESADKAEENLSTQENNLTEKIESADKAEENLSTQENNLTEKIEELTQLKDSYLRLMAEYDNYRKRTIKEKTDLIKNGGEKIFIELLPIIDDFERALKTMEEAKEVNTIKEGIDLIYRKFLSFLQQNGIKTIDSVGKNFESDLFEAVATIPAKNEEQKGKVIDNLQTGYILNNKVIRHAKVVVAN